MTWQQQMTNAEKALQQGDLNASEYLYWEALRLAEPFGPASAQLTETAQKLTDVLLRQSKFQDAEDLLLRLAQSLGDGTPSLNTASTLLKLAEVYYATTRYERAEPFGLNALSIYESIYGSNHPETARISGNVAYIFHAQGKYEKAEELYKRAIMTKSRQSKMDREALNVMESYATLLKVTHREEEATHMLRCVQGLSSGNWEVYRAEPEKEQLT